MSIQQISAALYDEMKITPQLNLNIFIQKYFQSHFSHHFYFDDSLVEAFIHKSFTHENKLNRSHNERLEFLGDSVLQLIISQLLFVEFSDLTEGQMSKLRSSLVNEQTLSQLAKIIGLGQFILMGKGEVKENGHQKSSLLANTFEAYLGALYRKKDLGECIKFLEIVFKLYKDQTGKDFILKERIDFFDYKTKLQERVVKKYQKQPQYMSKQVKREGKDIFEVSLYVDEKLINTTTNLSKKKAIKQLAKEAFENNLV